jgi:hypothetical protein
MRKAMRMEGIMEETAARFLARWMTTSGNFLNVLQVFVYSTSSSAVSCFGVHVALHLYSLAICPVYTMSF